MSTKRAGIPQVDELPNGKMVCKPHKLVVCGKCCVDFSFMDEEVSGDEGDASEGDELLTEEEMEAFRASMIAKKGKQAL